MGEQETSKVDGKSKQRLETLRDSLSLRSVQEFFITPSQVLPPDTLRSMLEQLILIRVVVLSLIMSASAWEGLTSLSSLVEKKIVFVTIALTYAISLANAILLRNSKTLRGFAYGQLTIDVLLSSLAIYATSSPVMISFYLFVIVAAAFLLGRTGAVLVAALSGISYAAITLLGDVLRSSPLDILGVYTSLVVIALVSSYIAKRLELAGATIASQEKDLSDYSARQRQLFDGLSEGVITLDLNATITSINEAAKAIIGLSELGAEHFVGKPLQQVFVDDASKDISRAVSSSQPGKDITSEIALTRPGDTSEVFLSYSVTTLSDSSGGQSGKVLRFSDVSRLHSIQEQLDLHERMTALLAETQAHKASGTFNRPHGIRMIGTSPAMERVYQLVERVAASDASLLISGESGTGKELIARSVHEQGPRAHKRFVAINCGAIPENLIESELFGHKKGAFTGAVVDKLGLFQEAEGGTVFLDEIGELPLHLQTKLLRVLQERTIRAVGGTRDIPVDVRILAATNRDLREEISENRFREDLYYRLNVVNIVVPPLRDRREDIPLLVQHFMQAAAQGDEQIAQISPEALQILNNYDFPGNIRELENLIERALVLGGQAILPSHIPEEVRNFGAQDHSSNGFSGNQQGNRETEIRILPIDLEGELARLEKDYLNRALAESGGVKKQAAELLGLNFRSFRYRLKKYGLQEQD